MNTNITKDIYIVECYQNGERANFSALSDLDLANAHHFIEVIA